MAAPLRTARPCALVALLLAGPGLGGLAAQEYPFRQYGAEDGVSRAHALAFDAAGQLFVGTNDGLVRFDGRSFELLALPAPGMVWRLAAGPDGAVWALTEEAELVRLTPDGRTRRVPVPPALRSELQRMTMSLHRLRLDPAGRPWLSAGDGALYRWNGPDRSGWTVWRVPGAERLRDFYVREDAVVFVADERLGEATLRDDRVGRVRWTDLPGPASWVRPHPTARAWVGSPAGVSLLGRDGSVRTVTTDAWVWWHSEPSVDGSGRLLAIMDSPSGLFVARFAPGGTPEFVSTQTTGFPNILSTQIAFDPEGRLWVAHHDGLITLQDEWVVAFPLADAQGRAATVWSMAGDAARPQLWVGTYFRGVFRFDGRRFVPVPGTGGTSASALVVSPDGDAASWVVPRDAPAPPRAQTATSRGLGRSGGPFRISDGPLGRYETDRSGFWRVRDGRRVRLGDDVGAGTIAAADARGRLWLNAEGRVDVVWGDALGSACRCLPPSLQAALDTLNARPTWWSPTVDAEGRVWLGSASGLAALWERPDGTWASRVFGREDGLLGNNCVVSASPGGRRLWLGTIRGIQGLRVRPGPARVEPFLEIRARDGLPGETAAVVREDSDGFLWAVLGPGRIHRLDWRAVARVPPSPGVRVAAATVNGRPVRVGRAPLRLREGDGLALRLWPRTYRHPERVHVAYRLGEEAPWTSLGADRQLALADLAAGERTLYVRAVREGTVPGPATRVALDVAPPLWRSGPVGAALLVLVGAALYGVHRVREGQRQAAAALRQRIASDLHDEVGGGLTQVSLYAELIRRDAAPGGPAAAWAEHVGELARSLSASMRDVIWAIRPDEGSWDDLELRLKDAAVALLAPRGIDPDLGGEVADRPPLPPEVRQNVLLFVKEALHNAVRHGDPSRVEVRWRLSRDRLALHVRDDGRGFDPAAVAPGVGLASLRRRAEELGGTFGVASAPGRGTCLTLGVPLGRASRRPTRSGR